MHKMKVVGMRLGMHLLACVLLLVVAGCSGLVPCSAQNADAHTLSGSEELGCVFADETGQEWAEIECLSAEFGRPPLPHGESQQHYQLAMPDLSPGEPAAFACKPEDVTTRRTSPGQLLIALVVARGGCSFTQKVQAIQAAGYDCAVVINTEDSVQAMGAPPEEVEEATDWIPSLILPAWAKPSTLAASAITVRRKTGASAAEDPRSQKPQLQHQPEPAGAQADQQVRDGASANNAALRWMKGWRSAGLCCIAAACVWASLRARRTKTIAVGLRARHGSPWAGAQLCVVGALICFSTALRCTTLRQINVSRSEPTQSYHFERDEQIFEDLVHSVQRNWTDYTVRGHAVFTRLDLAKENYDYVLFPHPPLFVAVAALLEQNALVPALPAVSLVLHAVTAGATYAAAAAANLTLPQCWLALVLYLVSPLASFAAEKFWIDNMLACTSSMCVLAALWARNPAPPPTGNACPTMRRWGLVGLVFGLALNSKLTGALLVPWLLCVVWNSSERLCSRPLAACLPSTITLARARNFAALGLATVLVAGPWVAAYYRATGRLLPSAWPSLQLVHDNAYVQSAVQKSWYTYIATLASLSPSSLLALCALFPVSTERNAHVIRGLLLWPASLVLFLSLLGALGAGFQARFILPAVPALAIVAASQLRLSTSVLGIPVSVLFVVAVVWESMHSIMFGVLFSPLHTDLTAESSLFGVTERVLMAPLQYPDPSPHAEHCVHTVLASAFRHFGIAPS